MYPDGTFIVAGDFNNFGLKCGLPKFHQNVSCSARGDTTLDHFYTSVADGYKVTPLLHPGQFDHFSLFLLPKYTSVIKYVKPTIRSVKVWIFIFVYSILQNQFQHTDWSVYADQSTSDSLTNIDTYTYTYTNFDLENINGCMDKVTTHKEIIMFPNQKP